MGQLGRKQTVDSNLTAIHHSPKSLPTVFPPKEKKGICDRKKLVAMKISWLISLTSVKMGLFWCWQFNNGLCLCVSLANFSCAAGYDVCARRAGMEGVSYKWGKDIIFGFFFSFHFVHRNFFFFFFNCLASATSVGSVDCLGGLFHPCFEMETDNELRPLLLSSPLTDWKMIVSNEAISLYQKKKKQSWIYLYIYGKYFGHFQKPAAPQKPPANSKLLWEQQTQNWRYWHDEI